MTDQSQAEAAAHAGDGHPSTRVYLAVAAILAVLTALEDRTPAQERELARALHEPELVHGALGEEDAMEARRRLFYVGMTRAKERLHLSYSRSDSNGKDLQRAVFVDELILTESLQAEERQLPPEAIHEAQLLLLLEGAVALGQFDDQQRQIDAARRAALASTL